MSLQAHKNTAANHPAKPPADDATK
jgi:hypothetical protein